MLMWIMISVGVLLLLLGCTAYLVLRWSRLIFGKKYRKKHKVLSKLAPLALLIMLGAVCSYAWNGVNGVLILLHLEIFWMLWDLLCFLWRRIRKPKASLWKPSRLEPWKNLVPVVLLIAYFSMGWFYAHHVYETQYQITTEKEVGNLKVVQFADSHVGTTFHADGLARHMDRIQATNPDLVLITGDFVDDETSREDMLGACEALSRLHPTYGVYFCFGNHDSGYYSDALRGWSKQELVEGLEANGVIILEDEVTLIDNRFYIIGRADYSKESEGRGGRKSMEDLMSGLLPEYFTIVMDHQPHDYDNQAAAKADLVLSGHTHGGQLFPVGIIGELSGANCKTYGRELRDQTNFIVTSGIGDWAIKFRSGCIAEYVVLDISNKN